MRVKPSLELSAPKQKSQTLLHYTIYVQKPYIKPSMYKSRQQKKKQPYNLVTILSKLFETFLAIATFLTKANSR